MYKLLIRPILFLFSPEKAHEITTGLFKLLLTIPGIPSLVRSMYVVKRPNLETRVFGINFPNPVGLAAGFDKNASLYNDFKHLGFGFIEVGTVTPKGQPGNPKPRMFRLPSDKGLINRMGFNNHGVDAAVSKLRARKGDIVIGGNIGKNKVTPNERANEDYETCYFGLKDHVDYFVVNVSSPNTPGLRELQDKEPLKALVQNLSNINRAQADPKPILLKIAPDLTDQQLDDVVEIVREVGLDGIVATNTTISRDGLKSKSRVESGGLSGAPLTERSTEVIRYLRSKTDVPIIGVGGIRSAEDALEKLDAGADLLQIYTGFIYEGPALIKRINRAILNQS